MEWEWGGRIGQRHASVFLEGVLRNGRLPHALLLLGPEGSGRTTAAEWLVRSLVGEKGWTHPDVVSLSREGNTEEGGRKAWIRIDDVREVRERMGMSALLGGWKVAWIEEADRLSPEAANALLKELEEPSPRSLFLLRAPNAGHVLSTIVSRCQRLRFGSVPKKELEEGLIARGIKIEEVERLVRLSDGFPGRAIRLWEKEEWRAAEEEEETRFFRIVTSGLVGRLQITSEIFEKRTGETRAREETIDRWERSLRVLLHVSLGDPAGRGIPNSFKEKEKEIQTLGPGPWAAALQELRHLRQDLSQNVNPQLAFERFVFSIGTL